MPLSMLSISSRGRPSLSQHRAKSTLDRVKEKQTEKELDHLINKETTGVTSGSCDENVTLSGLMATHSKCARVWGF